MMKFKSIRLHDFMRYRGDNELLFSTDPKKNVTIVLGDNTFGKTTLAQAFRWVLYETFNETQYSKKKDIVILNNEVIAEMSISSTKDVFVEVVIEDDDQGKSWKFTRRASFRRRSPKSDDLSIMQIGDTQLTMQISTDSGWGDIINNDGNNAEKAKYKVGCVQETIENMFPLSLSNYFFFDGERWNDKNNKTADIKDSINTILGITGLLAMKNHLKDQPRNNAISLLRGRIQGSSGEYQRLKEEISSIDDTIATYKEDYDNIVSQEETTQRLIEETQKILDDNKKIEEDQQELKRIEKDIDNNQKYLEGFYADIVSEFSKQAPYYFSAQLLEELGEVLQEIDLKGKDIPGVTVDTIDYLLEEGKCICGEEITEGKPAYENLIKLKKMVPPEMLGGAAGKLQDTLDGWQKQSSDMVENIKTKADRFTIAQDEITDLLAKKETLERTMDRKTNLGPTRDKNGEAKKRLYSLTQQKATLEARIKAQKDSRESKTNQLDSVAQKDRENISIYRAIAYAEALYERASRLAANRQTAILDDLNEIIKENFQRMFNDHEKYAQIENDYRIHVYYHKLGDFSNYEEENLSNGEIIAINFVFIVSILELANKYKQQEMDDDGYEMKNAIQGIPLVLDGPFSALSNENTGLIANQMPKFAEQVIIFMLDKDWEASGLDKYTKPEFCYRVAKESLSNSSSIEKGQTE